MSSKDLSVSDEEVKIGIDEKSREAQIEETSSFVALENSEEERQLVRKLDYRILPIACCLYLCACASCLGCCDAVALTPSRPI
jgi:hypothetical protein